MDIHPLAEVNSSHIGIGSKIWQFVIILEDAIIGENCNINCHCFIENQVKIGNNVTIKSGVYLWDGITVGNNVQIGPNVTFTNDLYPRAKQPFNLLRTTISEGASIGANSTIIGGIVIGENALIGAGSVVTKSIPPFTVWYGNPATQKGYITKDNVVLGMDLKDKNGAEYLLVEGTPLIND